MKPSKDYTKLHQLIICLAESGIIPYFHHKHAGPFKIGKLVASVMINRILLWVANHQTQDFYTDLGLQSWQGWSEFRSA